MCGALCSDGSVTFENGVAKHIGDPTETSIILAAHRNGMPKEELVEQFPRLAELPFDSDRKRMTSINQVDGQSIAIVKGPLTASPLSACPAIWMPPPVETMK